MLDAIMEPFFLRILIAGLLASIACGIVGSLVVVTRMSSISGALSHAGFGGLGLAFLLGWNPILGAVLFSLLSALGIGVAYRRFRSSMDTLMAIVWPVGMALGILFVSLSPGYAPDLTSYLFGSLLFVPWGWLVVVGVLDVVVLVLVLLFYHELVAVAFDEEFAEVAGGRVDTMIMLLLSMAALTVVTLIRVVGVILAMALLTLPAETARRWCSRLPSMMLLSSVLGVIYTTLGMLLSFLLSEQWSINAPPGPLVILIGATVYLGSSLIKRG